MTNCLYSCLWSKTVRVLRPHPTPLAGNVLAVGLQLLSRHAEELGKIGVGETRKEEMTENWIGLAKWWSS